MVRNARLEDLGDAPRPIIAVGNEYGDGHVVPPHSHRRGQLLYGASGAVLVTTAQGAWVSPPQHGVWIPAGVVHEVRMLGAVNTRSLYLDAAAAASLPDRCQVVGISPFMRGLLAEAVDLPATYDLHARAGALMALIQHEMQRMPALPLSLPLPTHPELLRCCQDFLAAPSAHDHIEPWSRRLGIARRTFTRLFREETGLSFTLWRQQACLMAALSRLIAGDPVTTVALDLGYDNPAAFTTMFKRVLGAPPRAYLKENG